MQSFEVGQPVALRSRLRVDLVQLTAPVGAPWDFVAAGDPRTYADLVTPAGLRQIARYAEALGPDKTQIMPRDGAGTSLPATTLIRDAHRAGLAVHPYTFRNENPFLPAELRRGADPAAYGDAFAEYARSSGRGGRAVHRQRRHRSRGPRQPRAGPAPPGRRVNSSWE